MSNTQENTNKSLHDTWLTLKQLADKEQAFSLSALRNLVFKAEDRVCSRGTIPGNGLAPHIRRVGTKLLINHGGFLDWIKGGAK